MQMVMVRQLGWMALLLVLGTVYGVAIFARPATSAAPHAAAAPVEATVALCGDSKDCS